MKKIQTDTFFLFEYNASEDGYRVEDIADLTTDIFLLLADGCQSVKLILAKPHLLTTQASGDLVEFINHFRRHVKITLTLVEVDQERTFPPLLDLPAVGNRGGVGC